MSITSEVVKVSPEMALEWLSNQADNRKPRRGLVDRIARDITEGRWQLNGQALVFDTRGRLLDGQHRLLAIVRAGKSVECLVVRGVAKSAFSTMDVGDPRKGKDVLSILGVPNANRTAAVLRIVWLYEADMLNTTALVQLRPTPREIEEVYKNHTGVVDYIRRASSSPISTMLRASPTAVWYITRGHKKCEEFWNAVAIDGSCERGSAARALRDRLTRESSAGRKITERDLLCIVIRAWNAHAAGQAMHRSQTGKDGAIPTIVVK